MISDPQIVLLLAIVALGAYTQSVTGFALGLVVVGGAALSGVVSVALAAALATVANLVSVPTALWGRMDKVRWNHAGLLIISSVPAVCVGVVLLDYLSAGLEGVLQKVLALTILAGGVLLSLRPDPRALPAGGWSSVSVGALGGLLTGLFAAGGPPIVFHMYRQPLPIPVIQTTLLVTFGVGGIVRLVWIGAGGEFGGGALVVAAASIPIVIGATLVGRHFPPPFSERGTRRLAFGLLVVLGTTLLVE